MILIRTDTPLLCAKCGVEKNLVSCTVINQGLKPCTEIYCNNCLNKFEDDKNVVVTE